MPRYRLVPDFPGYRVGTDGSVWCRLSKHGLAGRDKKWPWRPVMPGKNPQGVYTIGFNRDGKRHTKNLGKVILTVFVGPAPDGLQCRHLDDIQSHNWLTNLRWGTPKENAADRDRNGRTQRGDTHCRAVLTAAIVRKLRKAPKSISTAELIRTLGLSVHHSTASMARRGLTWKHVT